MKQLLIVLAILSVLSFILIQLQQYVLAVTVGIEPSKEVITAIKNCTKGTHKEKTKYSFVTEYTIKGLLPNGRCEFVQTSYTDFTDKEAYDNAMKVYSGFADMVMSMDNKKGQTSQKPKLPTQAEMIKMSQEDKDIMVCKLSKTERDNLYNAWAKHDDKNPPAKVSENGISFSFDSSKMSSYDNLMMAYAQGPCSSGKNDEMTVGGEKPKSVKKYACEYADTTCYLTLYNFSSGESASMSCTGDRSSFDLLDKVKQHAKSGMCSLI